MGRKKLVQTLKVFLNDKEVGQLIKQANGAIEFCYSDKWVEEGYAISLSLPLAERVFRGEKASFYFDNLLSDNKKILELIAKKFQAESTKQFDILHSIGKDCVGALSFYDEGESFIGFKKMKVKALTDEQIAHRIKNLATDNPLGMDDGDFRISLAGAQEKMALLNWKNTWYEPQGSTPTSHILKKKIGQILGAVDFSSSVENEWACLQIAEQLGLKTCKAEILNFEDEQVLCLERFDRVWIDNLLRRVPQEDLCQALGVSPQLKYERDGGPSIFQIMELLKRSNNASLDRKNLFKLAMVNDLLHNTDGHAKNVSIYVFREGFALTPMYDMMSAHFLMKEHQERYDSLRSSWSVNGKFKFKEVTLEDWEKEASMCDLTKEVFEEICHELNGAIKKIKLAHKSSHIDLILEGIEARFSILLGQPSNFTRST
ncbi:MAG: HipA domain-containing protein [Bacteriovoracaceae bacterium]